MKALPLIGALVAPTLSFAQATSPATLEPVVVTGTRTPVPASEALAATTVITREDIERAQVNDIAELLRFKAGIELGRTGGPGQQTSLFIRGGESNHTLVLIDGVRVNPATSGGAALQNLAPDMIERIEIVRGPLSTLYGSDAIGGVVNIITRVADRPTAEVKGRTGVHGTQDASASIGTGDGSKAFTAQIQNLHTDGFAPCAGDTIDRGYDNTSINLRGTAKVTDEVRVSARAWNSSGNTEYTSFCGAFGEALDQDFQNQVAAIDLSVDVARNWNSTLTFSRTEDDIRQGQANFLGDKDHAKTVRPAIDWHNVIEANANNRVSFGLYGAKDDVTVLSFGDFEDADRDIGAVFAQDELTYGPFRGVLAASYQHYERFGSEVTWNVNLGYDILPSLRVTAAAATGYRAPDFTDLYGFGGNEDLDPEKSRNFEVGVRFAPSAHHVLDLRGFHSRVHDLINVVCNDDFSVCEAVNVDRYRNRGAELAWNWSNERWSAGLTGIVQKPEDRRTHDPLPRRAKRSIGGHLARNFAGGHFIAVDALGSAMRHDVGTLEEGGYALVDLTGGIALTKGLMLELRIENALDRHYQTAYGYNQPGAGGYVTLRYSFF